MPSPSSNWSSVENPPPGPAVIFDLDGTLADTLDDIAGSLNQALRRLGLPEYGREDVAAMVGDGVFKLAARAAGTSDDAVVGRLVEYFGAHYRIHALDRTRVYEGIPEQLDRLVQSGWSMAILSNKPQVFTEQCCAALLNRWPWRAVCGASEDRPRKPDPAAALLIADLLGLPPRRVCLVGDSPSDVATARAAGMRAVAVGWGYRSEAQLRAAGPDVFVPRPVDLADRLLGLTSSL
jgi:phosphoglycolate phosphatase